LVSQALKNSARAKRADLNVLAADFRKIADQDYIAARACYKSALPMQFLWFDQQAMEKYLKAILLFNKKKAKGLNHDQLCKGLRRIENIKDFQINLPDRIRGFLKYLEKQGPNRYLEVVSCSMGNELELLDESVWRLRSYCQPVRKYSPKVVGRRYIFADRIKQINRQVDKPPCEAKPDIALGYLENVLKPKSASPDSEGFDALTWNNKFFHDTHASEEKPMFSMSHSAIPVYMRRPENLEFLQRYAFIPKPKK